MFLEVLRREETIGALSSEEKEEVPLPPAPSTLERSQRSVKPTRCPKGKASEEDRGRIIGGWGPAPGFQTQSGILFSYAQRKWGPKRLLVQKRGVHHSHESGVLEVALEVFYDGKDFVSNAYSNQVCG